MALYEQWTDFGPEGVNGWMFLDMTGTVGTQAGSSCLTGWPSDSGQGYAITSFADVNPYLWDGTDYYWKTYAGTSSYVYVVVGVNSSGTLLGLAIRRGGGREWSEFSSTGTTIRTQSNEGAAADPAWASVHVTYTDGGTFLATWDYGTASGTSTYGSAFDRGTRGYPIIMNRLGSSDDGPYGITDLVYPVDIGRSRLDYFGSFNDGKNWGSLLLGGDVRTFGDVREQAYEPMQTRGWSSSVPLNIEDVDGDFSQLFGYSGGTTEWGAYPVYCGGTFYLRQQWGTTWTTLLTGFVSPQNINYDYANYTTNLTVESILSKLAQTTVPYDPVWTGTVSAISDGTVTIEDDGYTHSGYRNFYEREFMWQDSGTDTVNVRIDGLPTGGTWTEDPPGNWTNQVYFRTVPDWVAVDADIYWTPSSREPVWSAGTRPSEWIKDALSEIGIAYNGGNFARDITPWINLYRFGTDAVRYYGGERWIDYLHDMTSSVGLSYSIDGTGMFNGAPMNPDLSSIEGTIDFNTALNNGWTYEWIAPVNSVTIDSGWDAAEERSYSQAFASLGTGSYYGGEAQRFDAKWLDIADVAYSAKALADRTIWSYGAPRLRIQLDMEGSVWPDYSPGELWALDNIPARIPVPIINGWILAGKTYNYAEDITTLDLINARVVNLWRWDVSLWDGDDVFW